MDPANFLKWRKALQYTQPEAGEKLGVDRSTIQNWERGFTRVPRIVELACQQLTRRWKQRPEFGPVTLIYADEPIWTMRDDPTRGLFVQCELYPNNEVAIRQGLRLSESLNFTSPFIIDQEGEVIWTTPDLLPRMRKAKRKRGS
jgi:transcriptional regulator with XRE-family HTH domain